MNWTQTTPSNILAITTWKNGCRFLCSTLAWVAAIAATQAAQATTLTGFSTNGSNMGGMEITVNLFNGTTQTSIWQPTGGLSGGAFGNNWSLTQSGNTFGAFNNPWNFHYTGSSSVAALIIDAIPGNTVFDTVRNVVLTPGSADGWEFQPLSGQAPNRSGFSVPIDISQGDLFGRLSLFWDSGFTGAMQFLVDTDSGTTHDPVAPRDPVQPLPLPPNVAPVVGINIPTIQEGQNAQAQLLATDPGADSINFFLNGGFVGSDSSTSGTRSLTTNLGPFADNGIHHYTAQAQDTRGAFSSSVQGTLIVENVAPTLSGFNLSNTVMNEGQTASAFLQATDPGADSINFFLNGSSIGTDTRTSGIRSSNQDLGTFQDEGTFTFRGQAQDKDGAFSNIIDRTLTVLNVAPTITSLTEDLMILQGETFDFAASAIDPGVLDILTFDWDFDGDGLFDDFQGTSGIWSFSDLGLHEIGLRVSDGDGGFTVGSFNVDVKQQTPEPSALLSLLLLGIGGIFGSRQTHKYK